MVRWVFENFQTFSRLAEKPLIAIKIRLFHMSQGNLSYQTRYKMNCKTNSLCIQLFFLVKITDLPKTISDLVRAFKTRIHIFRLRFEFFSSIVHMFLVNTVNLQPNKMMLRLFSDNKFLESIFDSVIYLPCKNINIY